MSAAETFVTAMLTSVLTLVLNTWVAMLALGALHGAYSQVPAASFGDTFLGLLVVSCMGAVARQAQA